jgi:acyl-CoA synthetase (AMP-forming)/AMP-acid ligase II
LLNTHIAVGGCVILENRFLFPQLAVDALERDAATGFAGVPSTFAILLDKTNIAKRPLPALRYVTSGRGHGPRADPALGRGPARQADRRDVRRHRASALSYLPPTVPHRSWLDRPRDTQRRAATAEGGRALAATGEVGEIVARGSNIMEGTGTIRRRPRRSWIATDTIPGTSPSSDNGFLRIVGRKREMIKSGAHRIAPKESRAILGTCRCSKPR